MTVTEPIVINAALVGIGAVTVGSFTALMQVRDKVERMFVLLADDRVGVLQRLDKVEASQKRHSDEIKAIRYGVDPHDHHGGGD